ncbi:hypothetical protein GIB67_021484, partial [Kingdonia uniflora]
ALQASRFFFSKKTLPSFHFYPSPSPLPPEETEDSLKKETQISHLSLSDLTARSFNYSRHSP